MNLAMQMDQVTLDKKNFDFCTKENSTLNTKKLLYSPGVPLVYLGILSKHLGPCECQFLVYTS